MQRVASFTLSFTIFKLSFTPSRVSCAVYGIPVQFQSVTSFTRSFTPSRVSHAFSHHHEFQAQFRYLVTPTFCTVNNLITETFLYPFTVLISVFTSYLCKALVMFQPSYFFTCLSVGTHHFCFVVL